MPGSAMGVQLKSYFPWICSHAVRFGLMRDCLKRLRVSSACCIVRSHRCMGNSGSIDHQPAARWFLAVWIACSAALLRCSWGGTNWYWTECWLNHCFSPWEHLLLSQWNRGLQPPFVSVQCTSAIASVMWLAALDLISRMRILLLLKSYAMTK